MATGLGEKHRILRQLQARDSGVAGKNFGHCRSSASTENGLARNPLLPWADLCSPHRKTRFAPDGKKHLGF
jgi:hypothetical protein